MKKRLIFVLLSICCIGLYLHSHNIICTTDNEILLYIAEKKGLDSVDGLTLVDIIISDDKTNALIIFELTQPSVSKIFAWNFNIIAQKAFLPVRGYTQNDKSWPIKTFIWDSKYIVIINDASVKAYGVIIDGQKDTEKIDSFPMILKLPLATTENITYYDENMNVIESYSWQLAH